MPDARMILTSPDRLRLHMEAEGCTQAQLARAAGCPRQYIHLMIYGGLNSCTPELAMRIEQRLRVLPYTIFVPAPDPALTSTPEMQDAN